MSKFSQIFRVSLFVAVLLFAAGLPLLAEGVQEDPSNTLSFTDSYGRDLEITDDVQRVVSVGPNITEIVFALGKGDLLVGRTDYCDYPEAALEVDTIGSLMEPSIEKIIDLNPDLVLVSVHFPKDAVAKLESLGIAVVGLYTDESFDGVYSNIENTGYLLSAEEQAEQLVRQMKQTVSRVEEKVKDLEKPSVYYVVDFGEYGDFTAGGNTFINQLITMAGGINIAADVEGWSYSLEKIIEKDPDLLVCSAYWGTKERLEKAVGYKDLTSVQEGRLYEVDNNMIDRQGPRLARGLESLARIFHPEAFE